VKQYLNSEGILIDTANALTLVDTSFWVY